MTLTQGLKFAKSAAFDVGVLVCIWLAYVEGFLWAENLVTLYLILTFIVVLVSTISVHSYLVPNDEIGLYMILRTRWRAKYETYAGISHILALGAVGWFWLATLSVAQLVCIAAVVAEASGSSNEQRSDPEN